MHTTGYMKVEEAAKELGVTAKTIRELLEGRLIEYLRIPRNARDLLLISRKDFERFKEECRVKVRKEEKKAGGRPRMVNIADIMAQRRKAGETRIQNRKRRFVGRASETGNREAQERSAE